MTVLLSSSYTREMGQGLYIGKEFDPKGGTLGARVELEPSDLVTHGLIVGMTGSGKTGMAVALIEELLLKDVPVLAIDPKGDLGNLLLLFQGLDGPSFAPWIDPDTARREGKDLRTAAADAAGQWKRGLAEWGLGPAEMAELALAREAVIFTPGSEAGIPLNILQSLDPPAVPFESAEEDLRDEIAGFVTGLLGLVSIDADPLRSSEFILLSQIIEKAWREGRSVDLEALIPLVADPPFDKVGALPLETVYPRKERQHLMMALNNLLASPAFAAWRVGEPLDVARLLRAADGRPRLSIVYTAHLSDHERLFVTALILNKVKTWVRQQSGTSTLRAVIYIDEIYGYFPPTENPPTKRPLLTLLKQARAQGVGIVLATQNPVDLDYKGLANIGLWLVGRLQTEQDRARLRDGLVGTGVKGTEIDRLLDATRKRVFLMHDVHRTKPVLVHSRWAMSYLRGPLTRDEVAELKPALAATPHTGRRAGERNRPGAEPSAGPAAEAPTGSAVPISIPGLPQAYYLVSGSSDATPFILVKYAVRYKSLGETVTTRAYPLVSPSLAELLEGDAISIEEAQVRDTPPAPLRYASLPEGFGAATARTIERAIRDRLPDRLAISVWVDPMTGVTSAPGESAASFAARVGGGGATVAKLQAKLDKKRRDLAAREEEMAGRKTEKWAALGSAVISNVFGKGRGLSGASTVLSKNRMENAAEARVAGLKSEVAALEKDLSTFTSVDPGRFEPRTIIPSRTQVKLLRSALLWVY
jgi:hypothetical protein